MTQNARPLPLHGITVVSLEQAIAAPLATRHLADWGARVIKIERPGKGDFCRDYDGALNGLSSHFAWTNRSKESLAIDVKDPAGRAALDALLERADVFVQNLAPGAATRLGVDGPTLTARHPRLICCDVSGYGQGGPYGTRKAYDLLVQCEAGIPAVTGTEEEPSKVGISVVDIATGMYILNGVLMALYDRERTGRGLAFEVSLFDSIAEWMSYPAYYTHGTGRRPARTGLRHATIAPYGPFRAGDGKAVFFGIQNNREWEGFCAKVLGDAALATDARFASNPLRMEHRDALQALIEARFAEMSADDVVRLLDAAGIANARMNEVSDFLAHPQLAARGRVREVASPTGTHPAFLPPVVIPGLEPRMDPIPAVGEHTASILAELGLPPQTGGGAGEPD